MVELVYDDENIAAFWHHGSSDYLLVTFGDAISTVTGQRFFCDVPVRKNDVTCLGIMARTPNWFPRASIQRLRDAVSDRLAAEAIRVGYGGSMGAYGAIKHSALLGLTHVVALCPQWSIDPEECAGHDPGFGEFWHPSMRRHGVTAGEVAGRILVFFDPGEEVDAYHAGRLQALYPPMLSITVPRVGHHVTPAFAGSSSIRGLIDQARHGSVATIKRFIAPLRRNSPIRAQNLLIAAALRHPRMAFRAAMRSPQALRNMPHGLAGFHIPVMKALLAQGLERDALALAQTMPLSSRSQEETAGAELVAIHHRALRFERGSFVIATAHDSWVAYDMDHSLLRHVSGAAYAADRARYRAVHLHRRQDGTGGLFLRIDTGIVWLLLADTGEVRVALSSLLGAATPARSRVAARSGARTKAWCSAVASGASPYSSSSTSAASVVAGASSTK